MTRFRVHLIPGLNLIGQHRQRGNALDQALLTHAATGRTVTVIDCRRGGGHVCTFPPQKAGS